MEPNSRECTFFKVGKCTKGEACKFSHASGSTAAVITLKKPHQRKPCKFHFEFQGSCQKGIKCKFHHGEEDGAGRGISPQQGHAEAQPVPKAQPGKTSAGPAANSSSSSAGPLQIVSVEKGGYLRVCQQNVVELGKRMDKDAPVAIIVIVGPERIGKSTTATLLSGYLSPSAATSIQTKGTRFAVSNKASAMTKGIYAWPVNLEAGGSTIILDVEGLDSTEQESNVSTKLFSLALMLAGYNSGTLCYLHAQTVTNNHIEKLLHVSNLAESLRRPAVDDSVTDDFWAPRLFWGVLNFCVNTRDAKAYLKKQLTTYESNHQGSTAILKRLYGGVENIGAVLVRPIQADTFHVLREAFKYIVGVKDATVIPTKWKRFNEDMAGSHGLLTEVTRWSKLVDDKYTYSNFWNFFEESVGPINDGTPEDLSVMDVILQRAFEKAKGLGLAVFNQMLANHLAELDCLDDTVLASFGQLEAGAPELNRKMLEVFEAFKKHMYVTTPDDLKRFELEISGIFQREREKVIVQANLCAAVWKARQLELEKERQQYVHEQQLALQQQQALQQQGALQQQIQAQEQERTAAQEKNRQAAERERIAAEQKIKALHEQQMAQQAKDFKDMIAQMGRDQREDMERVLAQHKSKKGTKSCNIQ